MIQSWLTAKFALAQHIKFVWKGHNSYQFTTYCIQKEKRKTSLEWNVDRSQLLPIHYLLHSKGQNNNLEWNVALCADLLLRSAEADLSVYLVTCVCTPGRYQKYSRVLSQTPWIVDGVTKVEGSVQELVCQVILERFKPSGQSTAVAHYQSLPVCGCVGVCVCEHPCMSVCVCVSACVHA